MSRRYSKPISVRQSKSSSHLFPSPYQRQSFFQSCFQAETKRFSRNVLSNSIPKQQMKVFMRIFALFLQSDANKRSKQDLQAIAKVLHEEGVFKQFNNDMIVLKKLANFLQIKRFQQGQYIFSPNSKDDNLYKVIKGIVRIKEEKSSSQFLQKQKGHFIQDLTSFKQVKNKFAVCVQQCYLLAINYCNYQEIANYYLKNKVILKMLKQTPLFKFFNKKQIQYLFSHSKEEFFTYKKEVIKQFEPKQNHFYLIIQGQVGILKKNNKQEALICRISDGSLFGQECFFLQKEDYSYTSQIFSQHCKVLTIYETTFNDILKISGKTMETFLQRSKYNELASSKIKHYKSYLEASNSLKSSFHNKSLPVIHSVKNKKLHYITNIAKKIQQKVKWQSQIISKRSNFLKDQSKGKIDFQTPFFTRQDYPQFEASLKRFANEQRKAFRKYKLPKLRG